MKRRRKPPIAKHQRKQEPQARAERKQKTHPNRKRKGKPKKQRTNKKIEDFRVEAQNQPKFAKIFPHTIIEKKEK